jgi:competence protein ComEA
MMEGYFGGNRTQPILGHRYHFSYCGHYCYCFCCLVQVSSQPAHRDSFTPGTGKQRHINISGAVTNPGIYQFSGGDTIGSLIQSAGGVTSGGKFDDLELNIPLTSGITGTPQKININRADAWLLEALPGIGPAKSKAIIDYRLQNGFFRSFKI